MKVRTPPFSRDTAMLWVVYFALRAFTLGRARPADALLVRGDDFGRLPEGEWRRGSLWILSIPRRERARSASTCARRAFCCSSSAWVLFNIAIRLARSNRSPSRSFDIAAM